MRVTLQWTTDSSLYERARTFSQKVRAPLRPRLREAAWKGRRRCLWGWPPMR